MAYSAAVMDHFTNPRNAGSLTEPTAAGLAGTPGRGNFMVIQVRVTDGQVTDIRFQTYGCPGAIACGSMVTELARGRTIAEARAIEDRDIVAALQGLPPGKGHCAGLAIRALRDALDNVSPPGGTDR